MDQSQQFLVQKFGGTSLGSSERLLAAAAIIEQYAARYRVIAVVSAMSPQVKASGTTSLLLNAANCAVAGQDFERFIAQIELLHGKAADEAIKNKEHREAAKAFVASELGRIRCLLDALAVLREVSPRCRDIIMGLGERLSAQLLGRILQDRGNHATIHDLSDVVKPELVNLRNGILSEQRQDIARDIVKDGGTIMVATGFIGMIPGGLLQAVGRGYSDFTAAIISAGLGSERVAEMQVWKEVDGIFSTDPRRVPSARLLPAITTEEAAEITYFGSEVLHPMTMEIVSSAGVPIRIKNTFDPEGCGTVIVGDEDQSPVKRTEHGVAAVTLKRGIVVCTVHSNKMFEASGFLGAVFGILREHEIVVDLISTSEVMVSFTVDRPDLLKECVSQLERFGSITIQEDRAIVAVVGKGIRNSSQAEAITFGALAGASVPVDMVTEAASGINISCVVQEQYSEKAVRVVHDALFGG